MCFSPKLTGYVTDTLNQERPPLRVEPSASERWERVNGGPYLMFDSVRWPYWYQYVMNCGHTCSPRQSLLQSGEPRLWGEGEGGGEGEHEGKREGESQSAAMRVRIVVAVSRRLSTSNSPHEKLLVLVKSAEQRNQIINVRAEISTKLWWRWRWWRW